MGNIFCCGRPEDEANQRQGEDYKHGEEGHIDRHGQLVTEDGSRLFPEAAKHREKADKAGRPPKFGVVCFIIVLYCISIQRIVVALLNQCTQCFSTKKVYIISTYACVHTYSKVND